MDYATTAALTATSAPTWVLSELGTDSFLAHSQRDNVPDPSQDGFIMVVIDGSTHLFLEQLNTKGQRGGAPAAERLVERWSTTIPRLLMW